MTEEELLYCAHERITPSLVFEYHRELELMTGNQESIDWCLADLHVTQKNAQFELAVDVISQQVANPRLICCVRENKIIGNRSI